MKTIKNYTVIDHVGMLDSKTTVNKAYKKAYEIANKPYFDEEGNLLEETPPIFKIKDMAFAMNPNANQKKLKNSIRMQKNPTRVILITDNLYSKNSSWTIRQWSERVTDFYIVHFDTLKAWEVLTLKDINPTLFQQFEVKDYEENWTSTLNLYKRYLADIWSDALGYSFSAPLFPSEKEINPDMHTKRKVKPTDTGSYGCKRTTRPEKYRRYKAVAPDQEIEEFYLHYKYYRNNGIENFLTIDYSLCECCGTPLYNRTEDPYCPVCNTFNSNNINQIITPYYDTENIDEEPWLDDIDETVDEEDFEEFFG